MEMDIMNFDIKKEEPLDIELELSDCDKTGVPSLSTVSIENEFVENIQHIRREAEDEHFKNVLDNKKNINEPNITSTEGSKMCDVRTDSIIDNQLYLCDICKLIMPNKKYFEYHMLTHHKILWDDKTNEEITCIPAKMVLDLPNDNYKNDKLNSSPHQYDKVIRKCNVCKIKYYDTLSLHDHIKTTHVTIKTNTMKKCETNYKCTICSLTFRSYGQFYAHFLDNHDKQSLICEICKAIFSTFKKLAAHKIAIHDTDYIARFSKRKLPEHEELKYVLGNTALKLLINNANNRESSSIPETNTTNTYNNKDIRECKLCLIKCYGIINLHTHIKALHLTKTQDMCKPYECNMCPETFSNYDHFYEHFINNHDSNSIKCKNCETIFSTFELLVTHQKQELSRLKRKLRRNKLSDNPEMRKKNKPFHCYMCDRTYRTIHILRKHMKLLHFAQKYECRLCKKICDTHYIWKRHQYLHEMGLVEKFECNVCMKKFNKVHLEKHKRMHIKDFKCTKCSLWFRQEILLNNHMIVHEPGYIAPRNYICAFCDKKFKTKSVLKQHINTHTGKRQFKCKFCGAHFASNWSVSRHIKGKHKSK